MGHWVIGMRSQARHSETHPHRAHCMQVWEGGAAVHTGARRRGGGGGCASSRRRSALVPAGAGAPQQSAMLRTPPPRRHAQCALTGGERGGDLWPRAAPRRVRVGPPARAAGGGMGHAPWAAAGAAPRGLQASRQGARARRFSETPLGPLTRAHRAAAHPNGRALQRRAAQQHTRARGPLVRAPPMRRPAAPVGQEPRIPRSRPRVGRNKLHASAEHV